MQRIFIACVACMAIISGILMYSWYDATINYTATEGRVIDFCKDNNGRLAVDYHFLVNGQKRTGRAYVGEGSTIIIGEEYKVRYHSKKPHLSTIEFRGDEANFY